MKGRTLPYSPQLDGLRFIAVSFVFYEHFGWNPLNRPGIPWLSFDPGYYGVDLFFVISGFLITSILLKDSSEGFWASYRRFQGRRLLRIFPIYYALLGLLLLLNAPSVREMAPYLLSYTFNYAVNISDDSGPFFYLWSLSVEEQFYLFWPLLALAFRKRTGTLLLLTSAIVCIGYGQLTFNLFPEISKFNYTGLINRMGSLGIGSLGAILQAGSLARGGGGGWLRSRTLEGFALLVLSLTLFVQFPGRFPLMGVSSLFFVIKAFHCEIRLPILKHILGIPFVAYLGSISYGLYLFHIPIQFYLTESVFTPIWERIPFEQFGSLSVLRWHSWIVKLPLFSVLTVAIAMLSFERFEKPLLRWRDRINRSPQ